MLSQFTKIAAGMALLALLYAAAAPVWAGEPLAKIHSRTGDLNEPLWAIPASKTPADPTVIYRSNDGGQSWEVTNPLPSRFAQPAAATSMSSVKTAWDSIYLVVGTDGEGIYRTTDRGDTWTQWNDANVSIAQVDGGERSSYMGAISTDGAAYLTPNSGNEWTLQQDAPLSTISMTQDGSTTTVGTSDGRVIEIDNSYFVTTDLTDSADGSITPLPGPVHAIVNNSRGWLMAVVEHADGTRKLYDGSGAASGQPWQSLQIASATESVTHLSGSGTGFITVITEDPDPAMYVSSDNGASWTQLPLPVSGGINDLSSAYCSSYNCFEPLYLATNTGGFVSDDQGMTWAAMADTASAGPLTGTVADADLAIEMVSPDWNTRQVSVGTSRFELRLTNHGPDDVEDVTVELEFMTWREGSNFGSASWGTSATIDGGTCERAYNHFFEEIWLCTVSTLAANTSASIVLIHGLPADSWSMRLIATADADRLREPQTGNNRVELSPMVGSTTKSGGSSGGGDGGGGGAFGLFGLLGLLLTVARGRRLVRATWESRQRLSSDVR